MRGIGLRWSGTVTNIYCYKRPPRKKKLVIDKLPTIITIRDRKRMVKAPQVVPAETADQPADVSLSAVVTPQVGRRAGLSARLIRREPRATAR